MKWTWFNKDRLGVGFILGLLFILLGLYCFVEYMSAVAAGQHGAEIMLLIGSIAMFAGVTNNVVVAIYWLQRKLGRFKTGDTRD